MLLERGGLSSLVLLFAIGSTTAVAATQPATSRVVVAGGGLTEILYALGVEDRIVGVDSTSMWPPAAHKKPQIGYLRALPAEGILSLSPTLVLTTTDGGPASTLKLIEAAGVPVKRLPAPRSAEDVRNNIRTLAALFNRQAEGQALIDELDSTLHAAQQQVATYPTHPRVLFVLGARGQLLAGGRNTAADAMIRLAGGINVADYDGYKPLTPEAAVTLAPQVILTADFVIEAVGDKATLFGRPPLSLTPAGQNGRLVVMNGERLLGFGPRLGQTVTELARRLHQTPQR